MMLGRRLLTVPGYVVAWSLCAITAPLWLPLAAIVDVVRRSRGVALRCAVFLTYYLSCEVLGIAISAGLWAWATVFPVSAERWADQHYRLEAWWGTALLRGVVRVFGLRLEIEDDADLARGPYLMLVRHTSSGDTLLASALVSRPHGMRLRYVLKRELLWDPCLDIVGHRVPNVFVDRFSDDSAREIQRTRELARDLGPRDGILIHPEGTRFSEAKRRRVLERLHREGDAKLVDYARSLQYVLPPRPGGTLAVRPHGLRGCRLARADLAGGARATDGPGAVPSHSPRCDPQRAGRPARLALRRVAAARRVGSEPPDDLTERNRMAYLLASRGERGQSGEANSEREV
jgi:1-acyl-sn-glycerol-3-phosphate acyltransferase